MERIELSATAIRLRRNLVALSALIIAVVGFDIRVGRAAHSGLELQNLTTEVVIWILVGLLAYHAVAFGVRAYEDYQYWNLKLPDDVQNLLSSGPQVISLAEQMDKITKGIQPILKQYDTNPKSRNFADEVRLLEEIARTTKRYAAGFANFPRVMRFRFFAWDVGLALGVAVIAVMFALSVFPAGLLTSWTHGSGGDFPF